MDFILLELEAKTIPEAPFSIFSCLLEGIHFKPSSVMALNPTLCDWVIMVHPPPLLLIIPWLLMAEKETSSRSEN